MANFVEEADLLFEMRQLLCEAITQNDIAITGFGFGQGQADIDINVGGRNFCITMKLHRLELMDADDSDGGTDPPAVPGAPANN